VVAFVVPRTAARPPGVDELRDWVKEELPPWCAPRELVLRPDIPRTALGKPRRDVLLAEEPNLT
jgi:acyl-coenzyme A synthetase/AMP-(fatty) acid ligase